MRRTRALLTAFLACLAVFGIPIDAQVRPVYDLGAAGLTQALERLTTTASVLHTGAHPDDEDSAFLARAARGDHARVAYLALNRGEGGQNIIGPELFDGLGVIRTEELLQARRLDGARQFFTRAFDFGFSKTRTETANRWNERDVLGDMVRVIRSFRPLVVYSRFSGTTADGHGHHQMAGYLTPLAIRAAADPNEFPELTKEGLQPWQVRKLYRNAGFRQQADAAPSLDVATGVMHPAIGRTFAEIAAEGRSQHKSQQMGSIEPFGPSASALRLVETHVESPQPERSIFDGIDVTVPGLATLAGLPPSSLRSELATMDESAKQALRTYEPLDPTALVPVLARGLRAARDARSALATVPAPLDSRADADFLLANKEQEFSDALVRAAGLTVDPLADQETVTPGAAVEVAVRTFASNPSLVRIVSAAVAGPPGWIVTPMSDAGRGGGPGNRREVPSHSARFRVSVPANAAPTQPYFLAIPRSGDMYRWPEAGPRGTPFDPPLLTASVAMDVGGVPLTVTEPVQYRFADGVRGELRRDVNVVPAATVRLDSPLVIIPTGTASRRERLVVHVTSGSAGPITGSLHLRLPAGWTSSPVESAVNLRSAGDVVSVPFVVTVPAIRAAGQFEIGAEVRSGETVFDRTLQEIAYPHIQTHRLYSPAVTAVRVFDLKVAAVRVGYIMGSGDQVPDALRRIGVDVTMLDDDALASQDLSRFDTIVVGVRASEARPAFAAHHERLRQFMERGGTLIVQYQQQEYAAQNLAPYPVAMNGNSRVTDETAMVTVLAPRHPAFTFPNAITAADFDGWVQERNLYAFTSFDSKYTPLLESADAGEAAQRGAEIYAEVGKGRYVYTAYSWFRQLPAGVPGAYRQFANLISLSKAPAPAGSRAQGAAPRTGAVVPQATGRTRPSR